MCILLRCLSIMSKVFYYFFEYIFLFCDFMQSIKEGFAQNFFNIPLLWITIYFIVYSTAVMICRLLKIISDLFIYMYTPVLWFYADHQTRCCNIYLNVYFSAVILCRASNKLFYYFLGEHIILLLFNVEHQTRCCTIYFNVYSYDMIICRVLDKLL